MIDYNLSMSSDSSAPTIDITDVSDHAQLPFVMKFGKSLLSIVGTFLRIGCKKKANECLSKRLRPRTALVVSNVFCYSIHARLAQAKPTPC